MTRLDLKLFGYPRFSLDGRDAPVGLRKGLALLAFLAEAKAPVSRERIAELLWPEADPQAGRARLRRTLYNMRSAAGADLIASDRDALRVVPDLAVSIDVQAFETACDKDDFAAAAQLYTADFLAGFSAGDGSEFDDWAFYRREELRSRFTQTLERLAEIQTAEGDSRAAVATATRLVGLDPLSESAQRRLIAAHLECGDQTAAEQQYASCSRILEQELGVGPAPETRQLLAEATRVDAPPLPQTRYAENDGLHIAYQTIGDGPLDIVIVPGFVSHVERVWDFPPCRRFLHRLSELGRVIIFDRRGIGLSDRVGAAPTVQATSADIGIVMDAAGARKALLFGASEGGPASIHFAARHPERLQGLVLYGSLAKGARDRTYPHALGREQYAMWLKRLVSGWGGPAELETFAPSLIGDRQAANWWGTLLRSASSPGAIRSILEVLRDTDVRDLLERVTVPTLVMHRRGDRAVRFEAGQHLAENIAGARFAGLSGEDHWFFSGDQSALISEIEQFSVELGLTFN